MLVVAVLGILMMCSCGHSVPVGLQAMDRGLAAVDMGAETDTELYLHAVLLCRTTPVPACLALPPPEEVLPRLEALGRAYDASARDLEELRKAWTEIAPAIAAAADVVEGMR